MGGRVYILQSLWTEEWKRGASSDFVYKIGRTTKKTHDRIKGSTTMSANEVKPLYEIDCGKCDEKSWEKLLHYVYKKYKIRKGCEWFKVDIKELVYYVDLLCKATGVKLIDLDHNNSNKKGSNNIRESPTPRYKNYHSLALQLYKLNPNHKKFIKENKINKEGTTGYTKIVDGIYIRTNHDKAGLAKDEKSLTEEISKYRK